MKYLSLLTGLLCLGTALPAGAALDADVVLVYGSSWKRVLPAWSAAAKQPARGSSALAQLPPVILWSEGEEVWTEELLQRLAPKKVVLIGPPGATSTALKIPGKVQRIQAPDERIDNELARAAFQPKDRVKVVYLADGVDYASALAAAALATTDRAPLLVADGDLKQTATEAGQLAAQLGAEEVVVVGSGDVTTLSAAVGRKVRILSGKKALEAFQARAAGSSHLVVAAPADIEGPFSPTSLSLSAVPWAISHGASLTWAGAGPGRGRSPEAAAASLEAKGAGPFHSISLMGDTVTLPMAEVADIDQVARGVKNPRIHKVPAFVDAAGGAADRAVGRLAALDTYDLSRWVVRMIHSVEHPDDGSGALVLANADHKFVLGETISRTTSSEMKNAGVKVESFYRDEIDRELIQRELPGHGLVIWEGHPRDLTLDDDALPVPEGHLPPATFFLQGCYTLDRADPYVLVERGANAVIGTYMAVYSASGSGFARAYINSQLHGEETAGQALSSARNYLLATVELKKRRGHKDWRKTLRAALSFELWGDPTAPLPVAMGKKPKKAPVQARLRGKDLTVTIPAAKLPKANAGDYFASIRPGAVLSALYDEKPPEGGRRLIELFFVEFDVPEEFGDDPQIVGPYEPSTYAWVFSRRTRKLSLLIHENTLPAPGKPGVLQFTVEKGA